MGILEGPNLGDIAQYSRNFRLRRQQFQGAYGASRHKRCAGGSGGSNGPPSGGRRTLGWAGAVRRCVGSLSRRDGPALIIYLHDPGG